MSQITAKERAEIAHQLGVNEQYLYQCLTGRRDMDAGEARRVETESGGRLRCWQLRRDWHRIWPELIGADGAPEVPAQDPTDPPKPSKPDPKEEHAQATGRRVDHALAMKVPPEVDRRVELRRQKFRERGEHSCVARAKLARTMKKPEGA